MTEHKSTGHDQNHANTSASGYYARARKLVTCTQVDGRAMREAIAWDLTNKIPQLKRRSDTLGDWNPAPDALDELCALVLGAGEHNNTFEYQRKFDALSRIGHRYKYVGHSGARDPAYYIVQVPFVRVGSETLKREERRIEIRHAVIEDMLDSVFGDAREVMVLWQW